MLFFTLTPALATILLPLLSTALDQDVNPQLVSNLITADSDRDRWAMLSDRDYVYNFSANPLYSFSPGSVCNADIATFPITQITDMTVTQLNIGPCGVIPPHFHRAGNMVVAVAGTTHTYMYPEDGARVVETDLSPGLMTVFPQASLHSMVNEGCGNNQLYSFLNSADAGRVTAINALLQFGYDIFSDVLPFCAGGNVSAGTYNSTAAQTPPVAAGVIAGYQACLLRCGLTEARPGSRFIRT